MKKVCLALLFGVSVGGYSETVPTFENCDKTYIEPFLVGLHDNKIEIENNGEVIQASAVFSDDLGLYYTSYLKTEKVEEPVTIDLTPLLTSEDCFSTDAQIEPLKEIEIETIAPAPMEEPQPMKALPILTEQKQTKSWPYNNRRHRLQ
jgi:hypothetical protein